MITIDDDDDDDDDDDMMTSLDRHHSPKKVRHVGLEQNGFCEHVIVIARAEARNACASSLLFFGIQNEVSRKFKSIVDVVYLDVCVCVCVCVFTLRSRTCCLLNCMPNTK